MARRVEIVPNGFYDPGNQPTISGRTRLTQTTTLAKFLGSHSDPNGLSHLSNSDKLLLAKQYYLHAEVIELINSSPGLRGAKGFENFRMVVSEGYYREGPSEDLDVTDGINYLKTNGRAVVYELINQKGEIAFDKTFDLAVYLKNNIEYEKLILNYDSYNPDGTLHVDIILIMPEIISPWSVTYNNIIETRFNNSVQATGELLEIGEEEKTEETGADPLDESKPFAIFGTGATGFGTGLTGFFYPVYLQESKVGEASHIHTFVEYPGINFYMPNSSKNHAKKDYNKNLYNLYPSNKSSSGSSSSGVGEY